MRPLPLLFAVALVCPACAAPVEPIVDDGERAPVVVALPVPEELQCVAPTEGEDVGEACEELSTCQVACSAIMYLGCAGIAAACGAADVITIGGSFILCDLAIGLACGSATAGVAACLGVLC